MRLGPWVQSEAPRLSLGRGGEPRAHSVPRSPIFPRPHSSAIADTTLPHALTLLLLGYSSETWWQSRLASSTRRFAQVSRQALPPLAASPARSRSPQIQCARILRPARTPTPPPPLMRPQRRAATCAPHAATLTRRPWHAGSRISHCSHCAAGVWLSHAPWRSATGACSAASRRRAAWNTAWCRRRPWRTTPQDTRCASPQDLGGCLTRLAQPESRRECFYEYTQGETRTHTRRGTPCGVESRLFVRSYLSTTTFSIIRRHRSLRAGPAR